MGWEGALATVVEDAAEQVFVVLYDVPALGRDGAGRLGGRRRSALYRKIRVRVQTLDGDVLCLALRPRRLRGRPALGALPRHPRGRRGEGRRARRLRQGPAHPPLQVAGRLRPRRTAGRTGTRLYVGDVSNDAFALAARRRGRAARPARPSTPSTSPWSWARAGSRPPTRSATPAAELAGDGAARVRAARRRGPRRADPGRSRPAGCARWSSSAGRTCTRAAASTPVVHGVRTALAAGVRDDRADQRGGRPAARAPAGRRPGADLRPPEPDRREPAHRRDVPRPHRGCTRRGCAPSPGRSTRRCRRASTRRSAARPTRRPPRSGCCARWAPT